MTPGESYDLTLDQSALVLATGTIYGTWLVDGSLM